MARKKQKPRLRKKHNADARARRFFDRATIWTWEAQRDANDEQLHPQGMLTTAKGFEELEERIVAGVMYQKANNWFFAVRALCAAPDGSTWVSYEFDHIGGMLNGNGDKYWPLREKVLNRQRLDQVIDVGWIAQNYVKQSPAEDPERLSAMMEFRTGFITDYRRDLWRQVHDDVMSEGQAA